MPLGREREVRYESRPGAGEGNGQGGPGGPEWGRLGTSWGRAQGWEDQARRGEGGHPTQTLRTHAEFWQGPQAGWTDAQRTSRHQDSEEQQGYHPPDRP